MSSSPAKAALPFAIPMMALACGVMVGNIYLCQPLLAQIAQQFGVPERGAALVAGLTQVGYGLGVLFIVPLADVARPSRLVRWLTGLTALSLAAAAIAPSVALLAVFGLTAATTTVLPQVLMPLAPALAPPERRGRAVAALMTGLILGILLSRTLSGLIAQGAGTWRAAYGAASALTLCLFFVLPPFLPQRDPAPDRPSYLSLLASLPALLRYGALRQSMAMNFFAFGAFSAIWATLVFHLHEAPFFLGPGAAGLFGLWGAPGALLAPMAGRLSDRWGSDRVNLMGLCAIGLALLLAATLGRTEILALVATVNLLDFGGQSGQIANQTRIFGLGDHMRGRLNTLYMAGTFSGGALGAIGGGVAMSHAGWPGVCAFAGTLVACSMAVLGISVAARRRAPPVRA